MTLLPTLPGLVAPINVRDASAFPVLLRGHGMIQVLSQSADTPTRPAECVICSAAGVLVYRPEMVALRSPVGGLTYLVRIPETAPLPPGIFSIHWSLKGAGAGVLQVSVPDSPWNQAADIDDGFGACYSSFVVIPAGGQADIIPPFIMRSDLRVGFALRSTTGPEYTTHARVVQVLENGWRVDAHPASSAELFCDYVIYPPG